MPATQDGEMAWRWNDSMRSQGHAFWKAYAWEREEIGAKRAQRFLKSLLTESGLASILLIPTTSSFRLPPDDAVIDQLLAANAPKTAHLARITGEPVDLARVNLYRKGAHIDGSTLTPWPSP